MVKACLEEKGCIYFCMNRSKNNDDNNANMTFESRSLNTKCVAAKPTPASNAVRTGPDWTSGAYWMIYD